MTDDAEREAKGIVDRWRKDSSGSFDRLIGMIMYHLKKAEERGFEKCKKRLKGDNIKEIVAEELKEAEERGMLKGCQNMIDDVADAYNQGLLRSAEIAEGWKSNKAYKKLTDEAEKDKTLSFDCDSSCLAQALRKEAEK